MQSVLMSDAAFVLSATMSDTFDSTSYDQGVIDASTTLGWLLYTLQTRFTDNLVGITWQNDGPAKWRIPAGERHAAPFASRHRPSSRKNHHRSQRRKHRRSVAARRLFAMRSRTEHPSKWSFTNPMACMNAYAVVGPTNDHPRRLSSLLSAVEVGVLSSFSRDANLKGRLCRLCSRHAAIIRTRAHRGKWRP